MATELVIITSDALRIYAGSESEVFSMCVREEEKICLLQVERTVQLVWRMNAATGNPQGLLKENRNTGLCRTALHDSLCRVGILACFRYSIKHSSDQHNPTEEDSKDIYFV